MKIKITIPETVRSILNKLSEQGYEAVVVGGCVRDSIMNKVPHDWDIATSARPDEIMECFKNYRLMTAGLKHGTVTVIINHTPYEITTYRVDGKYTDFRRPDHVDFTSELSKDIERRDFTINSIAYDGEKIIDLYNGIDDIYDGIIRCVGNADERFQEDPLRIMRAIRFAARFGFYIEPKTKNSMIRNCSLLDKIAMERKQSEFSKAICGEYAHVLAEYQKVLDYVMPGIGATQNFAKTIQVMGECKYLEEKLAILIDSMDLVGYNEIVHILSEIMKYPNKVVNSVRNIIIGRTVVLCNSDIYIKEMLFKFPQNDVEHILNYKYAKIKYCNTLTDSDILEEIDDIRSRLSSIVNNEKGCYNFKGLAINGRDLKGLGVSEVAIKKYLTTLLNLVVTGQIENDKETLIEAAKISLL